MEQLSFLPSKKIINVASVPMRSPFRYPGGKTWLVPRIRQWISNLPQKPAELIEPFTGGGIIGLTVAFEQLANHVTLVELDDEVAAVWQTILNEGEWLANHIIAFNLTYTTVKTELSKSHITLKEKAFQTILKNRVNRGGMLVKEAGMLKYGDKGRGIASRWYPETLRRRILDIVAIRDRITFIEGDGIRVLRNNAHRPDTVFFIDPPYTVAGKKAGSRLYTHSDIDHEELFSVASSLVGDFLMTYSNDEPVHALARRYGFETRTVIMKSTHHTEMTELLIGRNLAWVDN